MPFLSPCDFILRKVASDISISCNTTPAAIAGLCISAGACELWAFQGQLFYNAGATPEAKVGLTAPACSTACYDALSTTSNIIQAICATINLTTTACEPSRIANLVGRINLSCTAGTLNLTFAQQTSSSCVTTVKAGSFIQWFRIS